MAVDEGVAGRGLGRNLAQLIVQHGSSIGVTSLYGLCYPSVTEFWAKQGFTVGKLEQDLESTGPIELLAGGQAPGGTFDCEPGNHFFVMSLGDLADGRSRFTLE